MFRSLANHWKSYFSNPYGRYIFILTVVLLVVELNLFGKFLVFIEARKGVVLDDPLLRQYAAKDFNTLIFILDYGALITAAAALMRYPRYLMLALQTYIIMMFFRFIAMYLAPLEVPQGCINLRDPLVFTISTDHFITKDLFFSGHIATLTILVLTARNNYLKYMFLLVAVIQATLILVQKVHYTIDIFCSPFFAFAAWSAAKKIDERIFKGSLKENLRHEQIS